MANRIRQMVKKPNTKSDEIKDNNIICNEIYRKDIIKVRNNAVGNKNAFWSDVGDKLLIVNMSKNDIN